MKKLAAPVMLAIFLWSCNPAPNTEESVLAQPQSVEISDAKYIGIGKQGLQDISNGNVDGFINSMADNIVYKWNNGDSIVGKDGVAAFWKDRRANVIDTISFSNDIWLSVKVNQAENVGPGNYLLGWFDSSITYATGKTVTMAIHNVYHFDANGKIDFVQQYLDRAPINAAMVKQ